MELKQLMKNFRKSGEVVWIGIRESNQNPVKEVSEVIANEGFGLEGDHYRGKSGSRHVTLVQEEDLQAVASLLDLVTIDPGLVRRNLVIRGINLNALKDSQLQIGEVILEVTGYCHPCSRMESNLGLGGYNAMRGRGGLTARILKSGRIAVGDTVTPLNQM